MEVITLDNRIEYYLNDQLHRTDGPALEYIDGSKLYYLNGKKHRTDGPAVIWSDCTKMYYLHDQLHRTDGPAIEWSNGDVEYWINGKIVTVEYINFLNSRRTQALNKVFIEEIAGHVLSFL